MDVMMRWLFLLLMWSSMSLVVSLVSDNKCMFMDYIHENETTENTKAHQNCTAIQVRKSLKRVISYLHLVRKWYDGSVPILFLLPAPMN